MVKQNFKLGKPGNREMSTSITKKPENKNSETNIYISAKELKGEP